MLTGTHFTTQDTAQAYLTANDWLEIAPNTWISDCGCHVASLRAVEVIALDVQPAPIVSVTVSHVVLQ